MPTGWLSGVGMGYSVTAPPAVMRPMLLQRFSVNQRAPSGPVTIPCGDESGVGSGYSTIRCLASAGPAGIPASIAMTIATTRPRLNAIAHPQTGPDPIVDQADAAPGQLSCRLAVGQRG